MPFDVNGTITIMPPPEGYVVNFADPPQDGVTAMWTVCIIENILAVLFLAQRFLHQDLHLTVLIAWVTSVATQGHLLRLWYVKAVGVHAFEMPLERYIYFSKLIFSAPLVYTVTVGAAKATLCLFYRRINPVRSFQIGVWILCFVCVGSSAAICFSLLFACKPLAASWDPLLADTAVCLDRPAIYVATAAIGVFTDVCLLAFPIPTVVGLKIKLRQKVALIGLFVVGSITMITSIVRLIILLPSLSNPDQTYALRSGTLWICIESNLLIMCCCLPTLRQFFRHIAPNWIGETKGSTADSGDKFKVYAMRTFGSGPARPRRKSQMDTLMRTQGTRIDDTDDYDYHKNTNANSMDANMVGREWENDARFGRVTDIRGGRDDQSLEGETVLLRGTSRVTRRF
ncbi:uncharacterized protein PG998_005182 [Apiospora kogelbergensis]|uniref:uncharacterized protein n=1 Tax=Apiospora kogelbergensis TaxID=1337665 RepID=UPI00313192AD